MTNRSFPWHRQQQPPKSQADPPSSPKSNARNLHPLWDRYKRITPIPADAARTRRFTGPGSDTEQLLHRAVAEVSIDDIERRALIMSHPVFGQETSTTGTMLGAFTVLDPGEQARPHRHTGAAIRFATQAEGAATIVNGRWCDMKAGDLILTPPMAWHGHINPNRQAHRLVRRRQHAAASRAERAFLRAGRSEE